MPGAVIGRRMNLGYSGTVSRSSDNVIINRIAEDKILFGEPVILNPDNTVSRVKVIEGETVIGIAVRGIKQETSINGEVAYNKDDAVDILTRGSITVNCVGSPNAGGNVYMALDEQEQIVFTTDENEGILLPNMRFTTGQTDGNGITEITIVERKA